VDSGQGNDAHETDGRFRSGRWTGYWEQDGRRARMRLELTFAGGRIVGDGRDVVGDFVISGAYDRQTGVCTMQKTYLGQHDVDYDGTAAADGIRGIWRIFLAGGLIDDAGTFHIWPVSDDESVSESVEEQVAAPV